MKPYAILLTLILTACKDSPVVDTEFNGTYAYTCNQAETGSTLRSGNTFNDSTTIYLNTDCSGGSVYLLNSNGTFTVDGDSSVARAKKITFTSTLITLTIKAQRAIDELNSSNGLCGTKPVVLDHEYDLAACTDGPDLPNPDDAWLPTLSFTNSKPNHPYKTLMSLVGSSLCLGDTSNRDTNGYPTALLTSCYTAQ